MRPFPEIVSGLTSVWCSMIMKAESATSRFSLGDELGEAPKWTIWHWCVPAVYAGVVVPLWVLAAQFLFGSQSAFGSATTCVLLGALGVSAFTDIRSRLIPNWITYPAILLGIGGNLFVWLSGGLGRYELGAVGISSSLTGFLVLFSGLLIIFSMSGGGAGDVKLAGAIGALMGLVDGAEAICLAFVLCAGLVMTWTLLKMGPLKIVGAIVRKPLNWALLDWVRGPDEEQQELLVSTIPLAPFFALGVFLVVLRNALIENPEPFQFMTFG